MYKGFPEFAFYLWASGAGDQQCAADMDLPISKWQRLFLLCSWWYSLLFVWLVVVGERNAPNIACT